MIGPFATNYTYEAVIDFDHIPLAANFRLENLLTGQVIEGDTWAVFQQKVRQSWRDLNGNDRDPIPVGAQIP